MNWKTLSRILPANVKFVDSQEILPAWWELPVTALIKQEESPERRQISHWQAECGRVSFNSSVTVCIYVCFNVCYIWYLQCMFLPKYGPLVQFHYLYFSVSKVLPQVIRKYLKLQYIKQLHCSTVQDVVFIMMQLKFRFVRMLACYIIMPDDIHFPHLTGVYLLLNA